MSYPNNNYIEIKELFEYCQKIGVVADISPFFDGYAIRFKSGGDIVQHSGSYGHASGCVEPAIGCRLDYHAVPLSNAKALIRRYKEKLNCKKDGAE